MRGRAVQFVLLAALVLAPALVYLVLLPSFGRLQYNDYYGILPQVVDPSGVSTAAARWLTVKSNEHTVSVPALVYAANTVLTAGDNRALSGFALLVLAAYAAGLLALMPRHPPGSSTAATALGVGLLVFTPAAAHSVVLGFSGTIWFLANAVAVAVALLLRRWAAEPTAARLAAVLVVAGLGALTYSTDLVLWPALAAAALLLRMPRRQVAVLVIAGAIVLALSALAYTRPEHHPAPQLGVVRTFAFLAVVLGNPLTDLTPLAGALGLAVLAGMALSVREIWRCPHLRHQLVPWLVLQIFAVGNAFGTAIARAGMGGARSSRYVSVAVLGWVALAGTLAVIGRERAAKSGRDRALLAGALLLILGTLSWQQGLPVLRAYLEQAAGQPAAELALAAGVPDESALRALSPATGEVLASRPLLAARAHVPFDRWPLAAYGDEVAAVHGDVTFAAELRRCSEVSPGVARFEGVVSGPGARELALIDATGKLRGEALVAPCATLRLEAAGGEDLCVLAYTGVADLGVVLHAQPALPSDGPNAVARIATPFTCEPRPAGSAGAHSL